MDNGYRSLNSLNFKKRLERLNYDLKRQGSGFSFYLEQKAEIEESEK
jgi:hypothetical protein